MTGSQMLGFVWICVCVWHKMCSICALECNSNSFYIQLNCQRLIRSILGLPSTASLTLLWTKFSSNAKWYTTRALPHGVSFLRRHDVLEHAPGLLAAFLQYFLEQIVHFSQHIANFRSQYNFFSPAQCKTQSQVNRGIIFKAETNLPNVR